MSDAVTLPPHVEKALTKMPALSPIVAKLRELAASLDPSPRDLVQVILLDPVLAARVIQLVNSSFYGLASKVKTLAQAVVLLGMNTVKSLAVSTAVMGAAFLRERGSPLDPEEFWRHCLAVALGAKLLAKRKGVGPDQLESYFLAGLFHDLGKVVLIRAAPDKYKLAVERAQATGEPLGDKEQALVGCSHGQAGGELARRWQLDPAYVAAIERHHAADGGGADDPVVGLVLLANDLSKRRVGLGDAGNPRLDPRAEALAAEHALDATAQEAVLQALPAEMEKAADFLKIAREAGHA